MRTRTFHGITSIGLVIVAVVVAAVGVFDRSWVWGFVYLAGCVVAPAVIVYAFCAKCPCRTRCAHVLFGKLAVAFTDRRPGPYSGIELAVVGTALVWLLGFPQVWLWRNRALFLAFWALNALAVAQIRVAVCPACENAHCPLKG